MKKSREKWTIFELFGIGGFCLLSLLCVVMVFFAISEGVKIFLSVLPMRFTTLILNSGMKPWIISLCIMAAIFVITLRFDRWNMRRYWDRACTGFQWRRRFPDASKNDIRDFLELFVNAFAFRRSRRLCFSPDDKIMEIYHTLYPSPNWPDQLEVETLVSFLNEKYGVDPEATFWKEDITLGELFAHTRVT